LLEKAGIVNEVKTIQATIDELRADSKKGLFDQEMFMVTIGRFKELRDEFGLLEILSDDDYIKAIEILEKVKERVTAEQGGELSMLTMPTMEDFDDIFNFLEKFKEKAKETQVSIQEVVVTGVKTQMNVFERMLDAIFGVERMDKFYESSEKHAEKAITNIGEFVAVTFEMLGKTLGEFFDTVREKFQAAGIGDFMKTLEDGFVKAGQLLEDSLTDAVLTGKLSFSSLADHIKKVLAKALIQKFIMGPILGLMGLASGGPAQAGTPYVVGEEGPELFVPRQSGTVIPNDEMASGGSGMGGATNVVYNIQATDAASFKSLVARDPEFIYNVTQAGARRQPA